MAPATLRPALAASLCLLLSTAAHAAASAPWGSRITGMNVAGTQDVGTFKGIAYTRVHGTVKGVVDPREDVVGLASLPKNARGLYEYESEFEIIAPAKGQPANEVLFVDAENRGNPSIMNLLNEAGVSGPPSRTAYKPGIGNGFFQNHATSYARVQWQTKISKGVPENAQGIGLVVMRDFARMLGGYTASVSAQGYNPVTYPKMILGGKSQSSWMVIDFIAEGFNVEPITGNGVFQGAIAPDGIGHWMALNKLAAKSGEKQHPYVKPDAPPLKKGEILSRPASDPIFIDTVAYTDFYRLRGSLTSFPITTPKYRRYDVPGPHGVQRPPVDLKEFEDCNNGIAVPLNPISMSPFMRAQFIGLQKAMGVKAAQNGPDLPPSAVFEFGPAPKSTANFNPLKGYDVKVPRVDEYNMPIGGVRFPDADLPLGRPLPVSLAPVTTESIDNTCGNRGVFQPFTTAELNAKYGSKEKYLELYRGKIREQVAKNFLLAEDEQRMLDYAGYLWEHAENYLAAPRSAEAR
jgi:Alpha/beta hydrolase domain